MLQDYQLRVLVKVLGLLHTTMILLRNLSHNNPDIKDAVYGINTAITCITQLIRNDTN